MHPWYRDMAGGRRMGFWKRALVALAALAAQPALHAGVDLSALDAEMPGPRTQVLVLGSIHLNQNTPENFDPASLEPVLERLAAFAPHVIAVETMPGETCDLMRRHPQVYSASYTTSYCPDTGPAQAATGLDVPAAIAAVRSALSTWPQSPSASQRRHLASLFLASGDPVSALVQWLHLPAAERRSGDGLDDVLAEALRRREASHNESYRIGARLAVRLGLQRVHPADDHTGDNIDVGDRDAYGKAITAAWEQARAHALPFREREADLFKRGQMLGLYRLVNSPDYLAAGQNADFAAALTDPSVQGYGRRYVAGWQARNLRMVSNHIAAFGDRPGARVLSIVGAAHKPWFDDLFGRLPGITVVDAGAFLADE